MVNLDAIIDQTIDFTLDGELIRVQQPGVKLIKQINRFQMQATSDDLDATFDAQIDIVAAILNNNTSGKKFTAKQIEALPQKVQNAVIMTIANNVADTDSDPN